MKNFNPKTSKVKNGSWTVFLGLCKGCGLCLEKCPRKAVIYSKEKGVYNKPVPKIIATKCNLCGICETICPDCAIRVERKSQ